jgi:hypothetical protein
MGIFSVIGRFIEDYFKILTSWEKCKYADVISSSTSIKIVEFSSRKEAKFFLLDCIISGTPVMKSMNEVHLNLTGTVLEITGILTVVQY